MTILTAKTAQQAEDYDNALKYYNLALQHEQNLKEKDRDPDYAVRLELIQGSIAEVDSIVATLSVAKQLTTALTEGETGPEKIFVRRSVEHLDATALAALRDGFQALFNQIGPDGYATIAGIHGVPSFYGYGKNVRMFLPWNRAFLWYLEQYARDHIEQFSLACWDWTDPKIPAAFANPTIAGDGPNPLLHAPIDVPSRNIHRYIVRSPASLVDIPQSRIEEVLALSNWPDFQEQLENVSNYRHGAVGGDMGSIPFSAFDPLYYAHGCAVDRTWAKWQQLHPDAKLDPKLLDTVIEPFNLKVSDVLDTKKLGYSYDE
jgi:tyrosinase